MYNWVIRSSIYTGYVFQVSGLISCVLILFVLLFMGPLFFNLPSVSILSLCMGQIGFSWQHYTYLATSSNDVMFIERYIFAVPSSQESYPLMCFGVIWYGPFFFSNIPADTGRNNNAIITSKRRRDVVFTMTLLLRPVPAGICHTIDQDPVKHNKAMCIFHVV